jgi:hypothetical protein
MFQAQFVVIREAIEVVLRHLGGLPCSDTTELFRTRVQDFAQETEMWSATSPTPREMDLLMKRVLALHIDMTKLERQFVTEGEAVTA